MTPAELGLWERRAHARNGAAYRIRPIRSDDTAREVEFASRLSPESRFSRLMSTRRELDPALLDRLVHVDYRTSMAFVAVVGARDTEHIVGVARYAMDALGGHEYAVAVDDVWQGQGVATSLTTLLLCYARAQGIAELQAYILPSNHRMICFARGLGFKLRAASHELLAITPVGSLRPESSP